MGVMEDKIRFEEALREYPYDEATRKVFADFLEENGFDDETMIHREWTRESQQEAEDFLKRYAAELSREGSEYDDDHSYTMTVERLIQAATIYLGTGDRFCLPFETPDVCYINRSEFWKHYGVVTNTRVSDDKSKYGFIRCAC